MEGMNQMINRIIYLFFLIFYVCSCQEKKEYIYDTVFVNGLEIISKSHKDSLNVEECTVYDEGKRIQRKYKLVNDLKTGIETFYYNSGRVEYKANYFNDTLNGKTHWYFDNENNTLKSIYSYKNGNVFGVQKDFFPSGNIKRYFVLDEHGHIIFDILYSEEGNIVSRKGKFKLSGIFNSLNFKINKKINYIGEIATPSKGFDIKYYYTIYNVKDELNRTWYNAILESSRVNWDTILIEKGDYVLEEKIIIKDLQSDQEFIEYESFNFQIND